MALVSLGESADEGHEICGMHLLTIGRAEK